MRDQYNFLKAIDTSSSSPELKESHRPRRQLTGLSPQHAKLAPEAASSSASSSSNKNSAGRDRAGLIKSKLQNLVRSRRFQLGSSGESKSSSTRQLHQKPASRHFACQEEDQGEGELSDDNPDDSDEEPEGVAAENAILEPAHLQLLSSASSQRLRHGASDTKQATQQQQGVPILCQIRKRTPNKRAQLMAAMKYREQQLDHHQYLAASRPGFRPSAAAGNTNNNQYATNPTSISTAAQAHATNYPPSETAKQLGAGGRQELAKCYDEIDQIYDYIRGLAPLPANLRKIKAIDFEQIERERQRYKTNQQQAAVAAGAVVDPRQVHHQHRQRYVKSIGSSSQSSSVAPKAIAAGGQQASANGAMRKLAKVRQRVVAELIKDREAPIQPPPQPIPQQAQAPSDLREKLQFIVPMPIRVTTKSAESQRPSIKRVESLNLGSRGDKSIPETRTSPQRNSSDSHNEHSTSLNPRPSYLISSTQRGQLFRLPRAHSTSTLNKQTPTTPLDKKRLAVIGHQKPKLTNNEPVIQEDFPLVRLAQPAIAAPQLHKNAGSLGRTKDGKKRPSFESDLVESYVDDDEDDGCRRVANELTNDGKGNSDSSASLKSRSSSRVAREATSSSSTDDDERSQEDSTSSSQEDEDRSASTSERWSYADDSSKNQRLADKSHSDYDNDSASQTSETTASSTSDTTTSDDAAGADPESRQSFSEEPRQRSSSSKRSHQMRPTTSSSPSSGRPASPVDMTNESDEMEMISAVSHKSSSFASGSRRQHSMGQTKQPREEHIYEQIPAHKNQERSRQDLADRQRQPTRLRQATTLNAENQPVATRRGTSKVQPNTINHPVAYAANVAANRRYQQQVAALFALQQQRERNQQLTSHRVPLVPPLATVSYHPNHQRRASASGTQFMSHQAAPASGPLSLTVGSLKWKHQAPRQLADVPLRQRLSMGNIHLLSGAIPLASLCSPKSSKHQHHHHHQQQQQHQQNPAQSVGNRSSMFKVTKDRRAQNTNSLDDQEAGSTGTTNSTSSYEAAIKNSEPDPLRIDMIYPSDGEQSRQPSSKRSIGSGSGSRSLTNQGHHAMQNNNIQQTSTLMKVPKLSKQSHLLQRPLPKPPVSNRSHASSNSRQQPQKLSSTSRTPATSQPTRSTAVDVLS